MAFLSSAASDDISSGDLRRRSASMSSFWPDASLFIKSWFIALNLLWYYVAHAWQPHSRSLTHRTLCVQYSKSVILEATKPVCVKAAANCLPTACNACAHAVWRLLNFHKLALLCLLSKADPQLETHGRGAS